MKRVTVLVNNNDGRRGVGDHHARMTIASRLVKERDVPEIVFVSDIRGRVKPWLKERYGSDYRDSPLLPEILVSGSGGHTQEVAMEIRDALRGVPFFVHILTTPPSKLRATRSLDAVVAPRSIARDLSTLVERNDIIAIQGTTSIIDPQEVEEKGLEWKDEFEEMPEPRIAVFIGGTSGKASKGIEYPFSKDFDTKFAQQIVALAKRSGGSLIVSASPRTRDRTLEYIQKEANSADVHNIKIFPSNGKKNPKFGMLAFGTHFVTTADSTSMMSELASLGVPLYAILPENIERKVRPDIHDTFDEFLREGIARDLGSTQEIDTWTYEKPFNINKLIREIERRAKLKRAHVQHPRMKKSTEYYPRGVLLDLDDTLTDSRTYFSLSYQAVFEVLKDRLTGDFQRELEKGFNIDTKRGYSPEEFFLRIFNGDADLVKIALTIREEFLANTNNAAQPKHGAIELIDFLGNSGIPHAIVTNSPKIVAKQTFASAFPSRKRSIAIKANCAKPDDSRVGEALRKLGILPSRDVVLIGDSPDFDGGVSRRLGIRYAHVGDNEHLQQKWTLLSIKDAIQEGRFEQFLLQSS